MAGDFDGTGGSRGDQRGAEREAQIVDVHESQPLTRLFTEENARLLSVLIDSPREVSKSSLAEATGLDDAECVSHCEDLQELGIIEKTASEGNPTRYDVSDTAAADRVIALYNLLA